MTYYNERVRQLTEQLYPKDYLTSQIIQAKQFIDVHYCNDLTIEIMAQQAFVSKFYFIRLFKTYYGCTPNQYLISVKIKNAKRLLLNQKSVSEVCNEVGFESVTYFTGLFKKMVGTTPASFQKKQFSRRILESQ